MSNLNPSHSFYVGQRVVYEVYGGEFMHQEIESFSGSMAIMSNGASIHVDDIVDEDDFEGEDL